VTEPAPVIEIPAVAAAAPRIITEAPAPAVIEAPLVEDSPPRPAPEIAAQVAAPEAAAGTSVSIAADLPTPAPDSITSTGTGESVLAPVAEALPPPPAELPLETAVAAVAIPESVTVATGPVIPQNDAVTSNVTPAAAAEPAPLALSDVAARTEPATSEPLSQLAAATPPVVTEIPHENLADLPDAASEGLLVDRLLADPATVEPAAPAFAVTTDPRSNSISSELQIAAAPSRDAPTSHAETSAPPGDGEVLTLEPKMLDGTARIVATLAEPAQIVTPTPEPVTDRPPLPAQEIPAIESTDVADVRQASATGGKWVVQIAAHHEENRARSMLGELHLKHGDRLRDLRTGIERSDLADGTLFRVWAGDFRSQDDARRLCSQLKQAGMDCFTRRHDFALPAAATATLMGGGAAAAVLHLSQLEASPSRQPAAPSNPMTARVEWVVQITARLKEDAARRGLSTVLAKHGGLLAGLPSGIERMSLGGEGHGTLHRAWIGAFTSEADAVALCRDLAAAGSECFARQRRFRGH
jgi:hypothetical protein